MAEKKEFKNKKTVAEGRNLNTYFKQDPVLHGKLLVFIRKFGLQGKGMAHAYQVMQDYENGIIQLEPVKRTKGTQSATKKSVDSMTGIRYLVKEVCQMPHVLNTAFEKARDNFFLEYVYCKTDITKKEMSYLFNLPIKTINEKIDKFHWKKIMPLEPMTSTARIIGLIYREPGDLIVVPEKETTVELDERYRKDFYKLYKRIEMASHYSTPDTAYINGLNSAVMALSRLYKEEREVNRIMSVKDEREIAIKERLAKVQELKIGTPDTEVTILEMPENHDRNLQAMIYLLKETMGEKGLPMEQMQDILGSLVKKMIKLSGGDEDEHSIS